MNVRFLLLLAGFVPANRLAAQAGPTLQVGDRVRVRVAGQETRTIGALTRFTADTVVVGGIPIPRASVTRLDLSAGRKSRWLRGLGIGFAVGVTTGAIAGAAHPCLDGEFTQLWCATFVGIVGGAAGLPIGAFIGSRFHTDRWRPVALDRLRLAATPEGVRVGFAVTF